MLMDYEGKRVDQKIRIKIMQNYLCIMSFFINMERKYLLIVVLIS